MDILGFILIVGLLIKKYQIVPEELGLSKENPKVKATRSIQVLCLIFLIVLRLVPVLGLDNIFSYEINEKIYIGCKALITMYIGNILPRIPLPEKTGINLPCFEADRKLWRRGTKLFGYILFILGFITFVSNFYFDLNQIYEVLSDMIFSVLFVVSLLCIAMYYVKIIFLRSAK